MYDLPEITFDDIERFADWVELCALFDSAGVVSQTNVIDVVRDSGILPAMETDVFSRDDSFIEETQLSSDDSGERFAEQVWQRLSDRALKLKEAYPFDLHDDLLSRRSTDGKNFAGYAMLLIADLSRFYSAKVSLEPNSKFQFLFEKLVEACARELFGGSSVRFGWPREADWPTGIDSRIRLFGDRMRLTIESLEGKTKPSDKDKGLDVAARLGFGDDGPGTVIFLTQCATGKNWRRKRGEPSFGEWKDILQWQAQLIRVVAVPWRLAYPQEIISNLRHFDAVILDRTRLNFAVANNFLAATIVASMLDWCTAQVTKFPVLRKVA